MTTPTDNKVGTLRVESDGSFRVTLSHFNRPNRNGDIYRPLTPQQVVELNARGDIPGCIGQPNRKPGMAIESYFKKIGEVDPADVAFVVRNVHARLIPDERGLDGMVQEVTAHVKPLGPQKEFLEECLKIPSESLYFGLCSYTFTEAGEQGIATITKVVGWNLIGADPCPDQPVSLESRFLDGAGQSAFDRLFSFKNPGRV